MSLDREVRSFHVLILGLKGIPHANPAWRDLTDRIGEAWQASRLTDDEAKDLETMLRAYRFPKK